MWTPFSPGKWQWPYRKHFPFWAESQAGIQLSQVAGLPSLAFSTTAGTGIAFWLVGIDSEGGKWLVLTSGGWYASDYLPNLTSDDLKKIISLSLFFFLPCHTAFEILVPWPRMESSPWQWKCRVLTIRPPENYQESSRLKKSKYSFLLAVSSLENVQVQQRKGICI